MSKIPAQLILEIQILNYCFIDHIPMEYICIKQNLLRVLSMGLEIEQM